MFEANPITRSKVDAVVAHCLSRGRGAVVAHEELQGVAGEARRLPDGTLCRAYSSIIGRAKRELWAKHGMFMTSELSGVRGVGYKIATEREQWADGGPRAHQKASRDYYRGIQLNMRASVNGLGASDRATKHQHLDSMREGRRVGLSARRKKVHAVRKPVRIPESFEG